MPEAQPTAPERRGDIGRTERRKRVGDYPTPPELVARVVANVTPPITPGSTLRILDPACGDGRFLVAAAEHVAAAGGRVELHGVELDPTRADEARAAIARLAATSDVVDGRVDTADALARDWGGQRYDLVVGNPPYLSQLAAATARGGQSTRGGGPYADVAAEFLHLAVSLARPDGGRVGLVLPQSILASRDVGPIRRDVEAVAELIWWWWSPEHQFDAAVVVCALGFERRSALGNSASPDDDRYPVWTRAIVGGLGVPPLPDLLIDGTVGDRARLTADFRDQYYGLVGAVGARTGGPRFVTSGLIDPLRCMWGRRPLRFGRATHGAPRVDLAALSDPLRDWATAMAVPKAVIANQTRIIECIADPDGTILPGVPAISARPRDGTAATAWAVTAVLTSPVASAWAWWHAAGTGLSGRSLRLGPRLVAAIPWPAGSLAAAVGAAIDGDVIACGALVDAAYGLSAEAGDALERWWHAALPPPA